MANAFFNRLQDFIDLRHPLAVLASRINWARLEAQLNTLIERKAAPSVQEKLKVVVDKARRIKEQKKSDSNKLYAFHALEVECIGKGKTRQPYEFGVKTGVVMLLKHSLIVGVRTFTGNPYDGHILQSQLEQSTNLLADMNLEIKTAYTDLGFRAADESKLKRLPESVRRWMKRRQAIEPVIGHLKAEHRLSRNWLKGELGDAMNAILAGVGCNIRWLLNTIARLGILFYQKMGVKLRGMLMELGEWARRTIENLSLSVFTPLSLR